MRHVVGLFAPLPTPYTDDGASVGEIRLARLMGWLKLRGTVGFAVGTDTGEYSVLSLPERKQLTEIAVREARGMPVIVNVTAVATTAALDLAQHAVRHGAAGCILGTPRGEFTDDEVVNHYASVAQHSHASIAVVDPFHRISEILYHRLRGIPGLCFPTRASGLAALRGDTTYTDEFSFPEAVLTPIAAFAPQSLHPTSPPTMIHQSLREVGTQRLVKAALHLQGLELGPLRGPYMQLGETHRQALVQSIDALHHAA